jgi:hypothetical protein
MRGCGRAEQVGALASKSSTGRLAGNQTGNTCGTRAMVNQ